MKTLLAALALLGSFSAAAFAQPITLKVDTATPGKAISPDLVGIFHEDLSHAAEVTVLAGPDANVVNDYGSPRTVIPQVSRIPISAVFNYEAPANSLTVIRW